MLAGPYAAAFPDVPPSAFAEPDLAGTLSVYNSRTGQPVGAAGPPAPDGRYGVVSWTGSDGQPHSAAIRS